MKTNSESKIISVKWESQEFTLKLSFNIFVKVLILTNYIIICNKINCKCVKIVKGLYEWR